MTKRKKRIIYINRSSLSIKKLIKLLIIFWLCLLLGSMYNMKKYLSTNHFYLLVLFMICVLFAIIIGYSIVRLVTLYKTKNRYRLDLKFIKTKYHQFLEYKKYNFNENTYRNIIEINNIKELLRLSKKCGFKIKYFESVPGEKCYFLLEYNNTLYKYILTKY